MTETKQNSLRKACGAHLKVLRIQMGLTQIDVAKLAGVEWSWYAKVEAGTPNTSLQTLDRLRRVLVVTVPQPPALVVEVGRRISEARKGRFSQVALSEAAGLNMFYVGRVERGVTNPGVDQIQAIASVLGVSPQAFLAV